MYRTVKKKIILFQMISNKIGTLSTCVKKVLIKPFKINC